MTEKTRPKYPIFIPSKNRCDVSYTADNFLKHDVKFRLVVEPQEEKIYKDKFGEERVIVLPSNNQGLIFARNFIKDLSIEDGAERHWQIDDNIRRFRRRYRNFRIEVDPNIALRVVEDFSDRYENIAISGLNYTMFIPDYQDIKPFIVNAHVYSCTLFWNVVPHRFRPPANEDVDICLQALADGYCTVQFNVFMVDKITTMVVRGGQTDSAYKGDGRLFMARALERAWPGVVSVDRRFRRPQHIVKDSWRKFDTPLKLKPGINLDDLPKVDEYGLELKEVRKARSDRIKKLLKDRRAERQDG